jgi:formylglycine-generating enzyme required for sulfatase activity
VAVWVAVIAAGQLRGQGEGARAYKNSVGIKMIRIPAGRFRMGNDRATDPAALGQHLLFTEGDYDEKPVHEVRLTHDFWISETEVTVDQFQKFRMEYQDMGRFSPYVTGVSWYEAVAFCEWLSKQEKRHYRLPTEAEWEYAARAGSMTHFASGDAPPAEDAVNQWGVRNMHSGAMEWTLDWYGPYSHEAQVDPVGPASGFARVVRGGGIMGPNGKGADGFVPYYRRSANRASVAPVFTGMHPIGVRLVEGELPKTAPTRTEAAFPLEFVKPENKQSVLAPDPKKPWLRQRDLLPIPPEDVNADAIRAAGLDPAINGHNHSAGVTVAPNGDVLWIAFSSSSSTTEYLMNPTFVVSRLRFGSDQWDFPALFYDFADVNDQSALLWNDAGVLRFFGGGIGLANVPFRMQSSRDNGATWSPVEFPTIRGATGGYSPQPITNAFRTSDGKMYVATDGASDAGGGESLLWASGDNGATWSDTGGRTAGRHTAFVVLKDGRILGLGGKNTDIDGYMPQAMSPDGGKTWTVSKTVFPALSSNQRPTVVRLASGRLFFAGDFQNRAGKQPKGMTEKGAYVALSDDEGRTWKVKKLPGAMPHEAWVMPKRPLWNEGRHGEGTLGYSVAAQAPNGIIHLITSMNHPSQHFELNEAWILSDRTEQTKVERAGAQAPAGDLKYADGKARGSWSAKVSDSRGYVLDGPERWFYPNGAKQYSVEWNQGEKTGTETLWRADGSVVWQWEHRADGVSVWTQYWTNGKKKSESNWQNRRCVGRASAWTSDGKMSGSFEFENGDLKQPK